MEETSFGKGTSLIWDVTIKDITSKEREFREWSDEYAKIDSACRYDIMKASYRTFIDTVVARDIRIHERHLFSLFGKRFCKGREMQYKSQSGWQSLSL